MIDNTFESIIERFEQAWHLQGLCNIVDFVENTSIRASADRCPLLWELIAIDLEFRWRWHQHKPEVLPPFLLEDYIARFPELISLNTIPLELIGEEYRVRCRWGGLPSHEEYFARFSTRYELILARLRQVDREIHEESEPRSLASSFQQTSARSNKPENRLQAITWLDHRDFLLTRLIGAGGMGKVYEARQHSTGCKVAVKFLRKSFLSHPQVIQRFIDEAQTIAKLHHARIVGTQGLGRTSGGAYFIVMDLVPGGNLAQLASRTALSEPEVISWLLDVCDALEHAHENGVVHCDLKPANLLLDDEGRIRVTDFGLARSRTGEIPWAADLEGTAPFMAPEQASRAWGSIDHRTDIYGLGAVLFALLTGRPPFLGRRLPDVLAQVVSARPVESPIHFRPDLSASLCEIGLKCLSKNPDQRYQTIDEIRRALSQPHTSTLSQIDPRARIVEHVPDGTTSFI